MTRIVDNVFGCISYSNIHGIFRVDKTNECLFSKLQNRNSNCYAMISIESNTIQWLLLYHLN